MSLFKTTFSLSLLTFSTSLLAFDETSLSPSTINDEILEDKALYEVFWEDFIDNSYYDDKGIVFTYAGRTFHLGSRNRNEKNDIWGVGYKGFEISTMINSFYDRSYIFSYHKKWYQSDWFDLGLRVGGITGYKKKDNPIQLLGITPLFSPTATIHYKGFAFETALQTNVLIFTLNYQF